MWTLTFVCSEHLGIESGTVPVPSNLFASFFESPDSLMFRETLRRGGHARACFSAPKSDFRRKSHLKLSHKR